ncbi:MAG: hypothetical protein ACI90A_001190, partial [Shewanella sp.]
PLFLLLSNPAIYCAPCTIHAFKVLLASSLILPFFPVTNSLSE